jgi:hypothetical protein
MPNKHVWFSGPGITRYHCAVTHKFPYWRATITGGDLPESGHVLTSMSYARLYAEGRDFIEWHEMGEHHGWVDRSRHGEYEEYERMLSLSDEEFRQEFGDVDEVDLGGGGGKKGFSLVFDFPWPEEVTEAKQRFRAAQQAIKDAAEVTPEAEAALGEPLEVIRDALMVGDADVGYIVGLPAEEVERLLMHYRLMEDLREAGLTWEQHEQHEAAIRERLAREAAERGIRRPETKS